MSRRFRFSSRATFVLFDFFSLWIAYRANRARIQRLAVVEIQEAGGSIGYSDWPPRWPEWLHKLIGIHYFTVVPVGLVSVQPMRTHRFR